MWIEIGTATVVVGLVGLVVKMQNGRIARVEANSKTQIARIEADSITQRERTDYRTAINDVLTKGDEKFTKIESTLVSHGKLLARIDERLKIWFEKNGML